MPQVMSSELRQHIVERGLAGIVPAAIAAELQGQVSLGHIYNVLYKARKAGVAIARFPTRQTFHGKSLYTCLVRIEDEDVLAAINQAAARRRWPRNVLIRRLVEASAQMIDAVLDDG